MKRIELPISEDYVQQWGVKEALRELFQNCIDREKEQVNACVLYNYDNTRNVLQLGNKHTQLPINTLLLGNSSKRGNTKTIGQFGEGYKLAMLVLLREGYTIEIQNDFEVWTPKLEHSETFNMPVLVVYIDYDNQPSTGNLMWTINITESDWEDYQQYNLHLQGNYEKFEHRTGELLLEEKHRGQIFVGGLFVSDLADYKFTYGYNFNPGIISLGRDRDAVSAFDVQWNASRLLTAFGESDAASMIDMIKTAARDLEYTHHMPTNVCNALATEFLEENPGKVIPVSSESERKQAGIEYPEAAVVFVSAKERTAILESEVYTEHTENWEPPKEVPTPHQEIKAFVNDFPVMFENPTSFTEAFEQRIFQASKNWMLKFD